MNRDSFVLSDPEKYDFNVMRITPRCPLAIQSPQMSFRQIDGEVQIQFDPSNEKHCNFFLEFNDLEERIWEKSESSLRSKISKITTDDMFRKSLELPAKLGSPIRLVIDEIVEEDGELPEEGDAIFLVALKHVVTTPTSSRCVWFIPKFKVKKKKSAPVEEPEEKYKYADIEVSDTEEEFEHNSASFS